MTWSHTPVLILWRHFCFLLFLFSAVRFVQHRVIRLTASCAERPGLAGLWSGHQTSATIQLIHLNYWSSKESNRHKPSLCQGANLFWMTSNQLTGQLTGLKCSEGSMTVCFLFLKPCEWHNLIVSNAVVISPVYGFLCLEFPFLHSCLVSFPFSCFISSLPLFPRLYSPVHSPPPCQEQQFSLDAVQLFLLLT